MFFYDHNNNIKINQNKLLNLNSNQYNIKE